MSHKREVLATRPNALFSQQEDANLDYTVNWVGRLGANTISTSAWELEGGSGVTISNESNTNTTSTARIKGDTGRYLFTNTIVLSTGETMQYQIEIQIKYNNRGTISDYRNFNHYGWA